MGMRQVLTPKRPRNLKLTLIASALLLGAYVAGSRLGAWSPKRGLGLAFGILAALLFVFEMLYPLRRPRARPLGTAKAWIQAHVYLGALAFLAVVIHSDFAWPHGKMGWALLLLSLWTTLSGLLGVWLQKWIPVALSDGLRVEALYERIPDLMQQLLAEADELMEGASDTLSGFYRRDVRPALERLRPSRSFLLDVRAGRERALEPFRRISPFVEPDEKGRVDDLMGILSDKMELDAQYSLQRELRRWLLLHAPPAGLLMGLLLVHVFAWAWY